MRSLTKDFGNVVAIEKSKDLSNYSFDALMSSLLAHETRVSRSYEKMEKTAFHAKGEVSMQRKIRKFGWPWQGRGSYCG